LLACKIYVSALTGIVETEVYKVETSIAINAFQFDYVLVSAQKPHNDVYINEPQRYRRSNRVKAVFNIYK